MSMSPPLRRHSSAIGVSTSPAVKELVSFANLVLVNCGIATFGPNKVNRLVMRFVRNCPNASGRAFFLYLAAQVQLSEAQKRRALSNPDVVSRLDRRADPVGWKAAINVDRQRGWR